MQHRLPNVYDLLREPPDSAAHATAYGTAADNATDTLPDAGAINVALHGADTCADGASDDAPFYQPIHGSFGQPDVIAHKI